MLVHDRVCYQSISCGVCEGTIDNGTVLQLLSVGSDTSVPHIRVLFIQRLAKELPSKTRFGRKDGRKD